MLIESQAIWKFINRIFSIVFQIFVSSYFLKKKIASINIFFCVWSDNFFLPFAVMLTHKSKCDEYVKHIMVYTLHLLNSKFVTPYLTLGYYYKYLDYFIFCALHFSFQILYVFVCWRCIATAANLIKFIKRFSRRCRRHRCRCFFPAFNITWWCVRFS